MCTRACCTKLITIKRNRIPTFQKSRPEDRIQTRYQRYFKARAIDHVIRILHFELRKGGGGRIRTFEDQRWDPADQTKLVIFFSGFVRGKVPGARHRVRTSMNKNNSAQKSGSIRTTESPAERYHGEAQRRRCAVERVRGWPSLPGGMILIYIKVREL